MMQILLQSYGDDRVGEAVAAYRQHYGESGFLGSVPYPGIGKSLEEMKRTGLRILSRDIKKSDFREPYSGPSEFCPYFDGIYGSVPSGELDHKPELLAHILSTHSLSPSHSLMVGDRRHDIFGAHRVGMRGNWRCCRTWHRYVLLPATPAGIPAIRQLTGRGLNINITLLFSVNVYEQVVEAYISGLEDLKRSGGDVSKIGSVASFFVSRIDTAVDKRLDKLDDKQAADELRGKAAIANAKLAYVRYKALFSGAALAASGSSGREDATPALGFDQHQKSSLQGHDVCRGAHRPRHRGHHPAGDDGCVPRSR